MDDKISIGIIGGGYVGKATSLFRCDRVKCYIYDIDPSRRNPSTCTLIDIVNCDLIFICVPTPFAEDGSCDISIVESAIFELRKQTTNPLNIIIRSTVSPFTSNKLGTISMPEFLTEKNWEQDFRTRKNWIVGIPDSSDKILIQEKIRKLINLSFEGKQITNTEIIFVKPEEAEFAKYVRNCFLACKVSFFNEIHDFCVNKNLDYENIRSLIFMDPRIGESHTQVPGHDGKYGFGGTCFPKDLSGLILEYSKANLKSPILSAVNERNKTDRK